ncbi:hypothetical protein FHG87_008822 [Trinorchestia longiramus]|nr:hypothetical protein FHG87_008822 [Trinorchestia longiramus]
MARPAGHHWLQMIMLHHLANLCCREFGALNSRLVTVVMVKRARFDEKATLPVLGFVTINKSILTASYEVAYLIAKQGKPLTIGETLVKPAVLKMANIMLGEETEVKLSQIPLSNGTISDTIEDMSKDILAQVFADLISSPAKFSLQHNETTDVSNLSQLAVLVRYVKDDVLNEDFFIFHAFATKTLPPKLAEVLKIVDCVNYMQSSALRHRIFKPGSTATVQNNNVFNVFVSNGGNGFIPFVTTHLCEQSFSRMLDIKTKKRNRHCCENDMRVVLAKVKPRISELVPGRQQQKSH